MKKIISFTLLIGLLFSCATKDDVVYFNGMDSSDNSIGLDSYSPTYHIDDELIIVVNALDAEAAKPFNKSSVNISQNIIDAQGRETIQTYRVDPDGNINFPVLGMLKIAGLNRAQATIMLQDKLSDYIKNPIVDIETVNYRITVLGEVNRPGTFTATNERITLVEAISLAGDLTIYGERENVLVIQDYDGKKTYTRVNLKSDELFNSPVYYLSQNDVVYVEPNKTRAKNSSIGAQTGVILTSMSLLISMTALVVTILNNN
ncbi:polysaccharide biosynthesis/export family protein [Lutimonas zeaxanthinifaciens]|uniref:polysaccharide biosynthesis/export family protein n=1 Tax=Lutimonas zeaxanthinifaciens TaxID=3060215 RepID=UPI00265D2231|nr:polysaccharide biosynthesis/export family protein [Lutimonas sp. YSD2104]WKK66166.1 polysaccharide biosynthesis/export family protein [Lutimonas sp. YSD2104]